MRYLAIDYGTRRLGLAVCDESETIASSHGVLLRQNLKADLQSLLQTVRGLNIEGVVFGLPRSVKASETGDSENAARAFADALQKALRESGSTIEIAWQDERFSTSEASNQMKVLGISQKRGREDLGAQSIDARAAAVILQGFLDARRAVSEGHAPDRVLDSRVDAPQQTPKAEITDLF